MTTKSERPAKRAKLLFDDDASGSDSDSAGGVTLGNGTEDAGRSLQINEEYAKRFEHNKKREERMRLEEKYSKQGRSLADDDSDDSTSEEEDDDGDLVTGALDNEIMATLKALKSKDPRIYDKDVTFYKPMEETMEAAEKKDKPLYLKDYHRQNLLSAANGEDQAEEDEPRTYAQEQDAIKRSLVEANGDEGEDGEDDFLQKKSVSAHDSIKVHPSRQRTIKNLDIDNADKDPETFLSNFMSARAWQPKEGSRFANLDSDDSEDDRRADEFEAAYNMRFEDPENANAKLISYGRDTAQYSVRREEKSARQKQREKEREIKEALRQQRKEEKARLRKLRVEEVEQKVKQIKEAAGLATVDVLNLEEWGNVLDEDFDDSKWEDEMQKRFGDKYYAEQDHMSGSEDDQETGKFSKKAKKPKWDDDIDIKDLLPDFDDGEQEKPTFSLSDEENDNSDQADEDQPMSNIIEASSSKSAKPKSRKEQQLEKKRAARKQRQEIESLVDRQMTTSNPDTGSTKAFRYRETSPVNFGLSARDILFADDTALNTFAGLKKTHAFRDEDKKAKDKKKLGKKARLREWRRDTFGNDDGYDGDFASFVQSKLGEAEPQERHHRKRKGEHREDKDGRKKHKNKSA